MEIYLDSNVYICIAQREEGYDYILSKINNLKKKGVLFPHAPPHAEEISARIISQRDPVVTRRFKSLIEKFNGGVGYLPGCPNKEETEEIINAIIFDPTLQDVLNSYKKNLENINAGRIQKRDFFTRRTSENFNDCLKRVDEHLDWTDIALKNDIFHIGRRNDASMKSNFDKLDINSSGIPTFEKIRKDYNLGPRRLANIPPENIFKDCDFVKFVRDRFAKEKINFDNMPKGARLMHSHHQKETLITKILNCMEEAGYNQEQKNHEATIVGRMHDVSHAIYATESKYFFTMDDRFFRKVKATYIYLELPVVVVGEEDFLRIDK